VAQPGLPEDARPTIEDVARAAGVSTSSARNYFSRPAVLSASTHARIEQAVRATGYVPRGSVGRLGRRQLGRLAFEMPRAEDPGVNPFYSQLLLALLWAAWSGGYHLHPFVTDKEPGSRVPFYRRLWARRQVGGFVLTDAGYDDERVPWLLDNGVPFVLLSRLREEHGYCWVDNDNVGGSVTAVGHLVEGGHRRIAYLGWPGGDPVADRRLEGYRRAVGAADLPELVSRPDYSEPALDQAGRLLRRPEDERPTAVVASCDEFAYDVMRTAARLGLEVGGGAGPRRVAVVGCDDSPMAARTVPTLTTLRQPVKLLAERAVDMLAAKIRNPRFEAHALERPELIVRESTSVAVVRG
jgi:LacI family transcriptional regulator, galactose operon repressor